MQKMKQRRKQSTPGPLRLRSAHDRTAFHSTMRANSGGAAAQTAAGPKITPTRFAERPGATFWKQNFGEKILPSTGKTVVRVASGRGGLKDRAGGLEGGGVGGVEGSLSG